MAKPAPSPGILRETFFNILMNSRSTNAANKQTTDCFFLRLLHCSRAEGLLSLALDGL
jgi:hypothetical protein